MQTASRKKALLGIVAAVMVCAIAAAGALAYLTKTTPEVTNTFVASGGLLDDTGTFVVQEHKATQNADGAVTLSNTDVVTSQSYTVFPGVNLKKDPFASVTGVTKNVYMFVEVVPSSWGSALGYTVNTTNWEEVTGVTGKQGGKVYVYKGTGSNNKIISGTASAVAKVENAKILTNDQITVAGTGTNDAAYAGTLKFYGYLCQSAGFDTPAKAFTGCF